MMMSNKVKMIPTPGIAVLAAIAIFFGFGLFAAVLQASAQTGDGYIFDVREIETVELGVPNPTGLAYSPAANLLLVVDNKDKDKHNPDVTMINLIERPAGTSTVTGSTTDFLVNMAFNASSNSLYLLNQSDQELDQVPAGPDGRLAPSAPVSARFDVKAYGVQNFEGMTFDPEDGRLFLLDPAGKRMIIIEPDENGSYEGDPARQEGRIERIDLKHLGAKHLRGMAYNPMNAHLYVLDPLGQTIYEINDGGQLFATRDVSPFDLRDPQGMVFAPSGDLTDDPEIMDLYLADSGQSQDKSPRPGRIWEFSVTP